MLIIVKNYYKLINKLYNYQASDNEVQIDTTNKKLEHPSLFLLMNENKIE